MKDIPVSPRGSAMKASPATMKRFVAALPASYAAAFGFAAIGEHARVWEERPQGRARVGFSVCPRFEGQCLFVVADDRPGLLAIVCAALVKQSLNVLAAEAYTRGSGTNQREAIDVFWVHPAGSRPQGDGVSADTGRRIEETINDYLKEGAALEHRPPSVFPKAAGSSGEAVVRFLSNGAGHLTTLEVEATDRIGLLLVLARALTAQRVQIVASRARTKGGRIRDSFDITELDDSPIGFEHRLAIQSAVLGALS